LSEQIHEFYRTSSAAVLAPPRSARSARNSPTDSASRSAARLAVQRIVQSAGPSLVQPLAQSLVQPAVQNGVLYAFVPARGGSAVGVVQERLAHTWSKDFGLGVLLVDFEPHGFMNLELGAPSRLSGQGRLDRRGGRGPDARRTDWREWKPMLEQARQSYEMVCADLTHATPEVSKKVLGLAHSIFLVSDSDSASVEAARDKVRQMRIPGIEDRCALLLRRTPGGLRPDLAEDLAEVPVCGLVDTEEQIALLARWLTPEVSSAGSQSVPA
jgi:hypothetical protein